MKNHEDRSMEYPQEAIDAAAWAIAKDDEAFNDVYGFEDYRAMARDALKAAQNVMSRLGSNGCVHCGKNTQGG